MNAAGRAERFRSISEYILFFGVLAVYILLSLQNAGPSLMMFAKPAAALTAGYAVFALFRFKLFPAKVYPELWLLGLYTVFACVPGLITAQDAAAQRDMAVRLAEGFALTLAVYSLCGITGSAKRMLWVLLLGGAAYIVCALFGGLHYYRHFRQTIGNLNPNHFARVSLFAVFAGIGLMVEEASWKKWLFAPVILVCMYFVVASGSRTALAALAVGCVMYVILTWRRDDLRAFYLKVLLPVCAAGLVAAIAYFVIKQPYQLYSLRKRFVSLFSADDGTASTRFSSMLLALRQFITHPLFGIGAYQFSSVSEGVLAEPLNHCHFDMAELLMSFGIFGFASHALAGFYGARGLVRTLKLNGASNPRAGALPVALTCLFAAYLILGIGDATIYEVNCMMVWGFLTACGMMNRMNGPSV